VAIWTLGEEVVRTNATRRTNNAKIQQKCKCLIVCSVRRFERHQHHSTFLHGCFAFRGGWGFHCCLWSWCRRCSGRGHRGFGLKTSISTYNIDNDRGVSHTLSPSASIVAVASLGIKPFTFCRSSALIFASSSFVPFIPRILFASIALFRLAGCTASISHPHISSRICNLVLTLVHPRLLGALTASAKIASSSRRLSSFRRINRTRIPCSPRNLVRTPNR
jgi:hypothetical protein